MKKLILLLTLLNLSFSSFSYGADLEKGIFELNRGGFKAAIAEFEPLVADEYAPAQYQMGLVYLNGWGVKEDAVKATELFHLAASQNDVDALFTLSLMYTDGTGVKKDLKAAYGLMQKAAKKGIARAQFNLGVMLANGDGTPRSYVQASKWYEKAAQQNFALAQFNLALMYFEGQGVAQNTEMSYIWNIIAANNGYEPAAKSRDMDEQKLSLEQIKDSREKAQALYDQIAEQRDLKLKSMLK